MENIQIPELQDVIRRCGCPDNSKPEYVLTGSVPSKYHKFPITTGILASSSNKFHARVIQREIRKLGGEAIIDATEWCTSETPTFSVLLYVKYLNELYRSKTIKFDPINIGKKV